MTGNNLLTLIENIQTWDKLKKRSLSSQGLANE